MSTDQSPQVVELTPQGRGAVSTLLVEGRGAGAIVDALVRAAGGKSPCEYPTERLTVRRLGAADGEEVVVRCRGEECVELHCHGGLAAAAMVRQTLVARGCRAVSWREWIAQREADPIAAAARAALAHARTERTAAILLDQYHGALRRAVDAVERAHRSARSHGVNDGRGETASCEERRSETASCEGAADLLARAPLGLHLTQPWRVVLAGRPNVGKSSLMNALAGFQRAIVHHSPGTTRDVVTLTTAIDGWPVELCDTAGLHAAGGAVEQAGVARAREALAAADLALLVFDGSQPWCEADRELLDAASRQSPLIIHNKRDLPPDAGPRPPGLSLSALRGEGIEALWRAISHRLVPDPPPPGVAVPFTIEQVERLRRLVSG